MSREPAAVKARRYLTEGRVILERVTPKIVVASVRGDGTVHRCAWLSDGWTCTCLARTDQCAANHHSTSERLVLPFLVSRTRIPPLHIFEPTRVDIVIQFFIT